MGDVDSKVLLSLRAQDIQTGLQEYDVPHFDGLLTIGMAARLALHIRGMEPIEYDILKELAFLLFGIPKIGFSAVLALLQELQFVRVIGQGQQRRIVPDAIPYFDDLYGYLSESSDSLNEAELLSVEVLNRLAKGPLDRQGLIRDLGMDPKTAKIVLETGKAGAYVDEFRSSDGDQVLISPIYFSEKPEVLADVVRESGVESACIAFDAIRACPGWPLEVVLKTGTIGNVRLHPQQVQFIRQAVARGILQPPAVKTTLSGTNHFLFTPPIGNERIRVVEKEIYEKAMAIIAATRQGQHFAKYPIRSPRAVIYALLRDGYLRSTSEAKEQWRALALLRVCELVPVGNGRHQVKLINTDVNRNAVRLALQLMDSGDVTEDRGVDPEARLMLQGGSMYKEALRGLKSVRRRLRVSETEDDYDEAISGLLERIARG